MEGKKNRHSKECLTLSKYYVICLTLDGIPLFTRSHGDVQPLPFPFIGSLNAVHMFASKNKIGLSVTKTQNSQTFWKEYHQIRLIMIAYDTEICKELLENLLDSIYNAMVFVCGENEFEKIAVAEKLKRKLKICYPLITTLLDSLNLAGNVTQCTDIILVSNVNLLSQYLSAFSEECQSEFSCLLLHGKVVTASEQFWQLHYSETLLILYLLQTLQNPTSCDIPIYLPNGSPTIPHRLICVKLIKNIQVVLICGPEPSLQTIVDRHVKKYWGPVTATLQQLSQSNPRNFPTSIKLDSHILSFLLINTTDRKCLCSLCPHGNMTGADQDILADKETRKKSLFSFYKSTIVLWNDAELPHEISTSHQCFEHYKCFAIRTSSHQLFVMFSHDIATYILKSLVKQTFVQLTRDKVI